MLQGRPPHQMIRRAGQISSSVQINTLSTISHHPRLLHNSNFCSSSSGGHQEAIRSPSYLPQVFNLKDLIVNNVDIIRSKSPEKGHAHQITTTCQCDRAYTSNDHASPQNVEESIVKKSICKRTKRATWPSGRKRCSQHHQNLTVHQN